MSLIKWKPFNNEIDTFDNIIDQFFTDLSIDPRFSSVNVNTTSHYNENDKEYYLTMDVPGISKDDIDIAFDNNRLKFQDKESLISIILTNTGKWNDHLTFQTMFNQIKSLRRLIMEC